MTGRNFKSPTMQSRFCRFWLGITGAAFEIHRQGDQSRVVMVQMPDHLVTRATFLVARLLDIAPHRIEVQCEQTAFVPHLCGWALLQRWYTALGLQDDIPDQSRQYHLPDQYSQTIEMCLQCSVEDWRENGMPHPMGYIAHRLRKNFLHKGVVLRARAVPCGGRARVCVQCCVRCPCEGMIIFRHWHTSHQLNSCRHTNRQTLRWKEKQLPEACERWGRNEGSNL